MGTSGQTLGIGFCQQARERFETHRIERVHHCRIRSSGRLDGHRGHRARLPGFADTIALGGYREAFHLVSAARDGVRQVIANILSLARKRADDFGAAAADLLISVRRSRAQVGRRTDDTLAKL